MKRNHFRKAMLFAVLLAVLLGITAVASAEDITESIQDHVWDNGTYYKPATCSSPEQWIYKCTVPGCDAWKYEYKGATNLNAHDWGDWVVDTPSTCTASGTRHRVCKIVNHHIEYGTIAPTGHDWGDWYVSKKPTCLEKGEEKRVCKNDPSHTETRELPATGHDWGDWVVTKQPTCLETGSETRTCKNDPSHTETREIKALGHDWGDWIVIKQPTCLEKGEERATCKRDPSHTQTREIPATGHDWGDWVVTKKPTCTSEGEETRTCKNDPSHKENRKVPATGHKWDDGKVIKQPTLFEEGEKLYTCENDPSHTKTEKIPKLTRYNNTVCAFGLRLRDTNLYPNNTDLWYMFTPFDASKDGVQTYELVASNEYIVGTLTLTIRNGELFIDYSLVDRYNFTVTFEFFTVLNSISDISDINKYEPEELAAMGLNMKDGGAINLADNFGDDTNLVLYFCSRCDYSASERYTALNYNSPAHQELLRKMKALMD